MRPGRKKKKTKKKTLDVFSCFISEAENSGKTKTKTVVRGKEEKEKGKNTTRKIECIRLGENEGDTMGIMEEKREKKEKKEAPI